MATGELAEAQGVFLAEPLSSRRWFWGGVGDIVGHVLSRFFSIGKPIPHLLCALASLREALDKLRAHVLVFGHNSPAQ